MQPTYNLRAPKKAANLSINSDLLRRAKEMDINLSATLEQALVEALRKQLSDQWAMENRAAIEAYNNRVEAQGVFSDAARHF